MDSLNPDLGPLTVAPAGLRRSEDWPFTITTLWGLVLVAAMLVGQLAAVGYLLIRHGWSFDLGELHRLANSGLTLALSVITGVPAVLGASWLAVRLRGRSFAEYLGFRPASWKHFLIGGIGLALLVFAWDLMSRATGREIAPGFMFKVFMSAQEEGALWLLAIALCVAAPISEEVLARGFLFKGWSETFLRVPGAIFLSSLAWTAFHLQYDWYFFGEVFCIGLWLGYVRYRSGSIWVTIVIHGLNNLAALLQTMYLAGQ